MTDWEWIQKRNEAHKQCLDKKNIGWCGKNCNNGCPGCDGDCDNCKKDCKKKDKNDEEEVECTCDARTLLGGCRCEYAKKKREKERREKERKKKKDE